MSAPTRRKMGSAQYWEKFGKLTYWEEDDNFIWIYSDLGNNDHYLKYKKRANSRYATQTKSVEYAERRDEELREKLRYLDGMEVIVFKKTSESKSFAKNLEPFFYDISVDDSEKVRKVRSKVNSDEDALQETLSKLKARLKKMEEEPTKQIDTEVISKEIVDNQKKLFALEDEIFLLTGISSDDDVIEKKTLAKIHSIQAEMAKTHEIIHLLDKKLKGAEAANVKRFGDAVDKTTRLEEQIVSLEKKLEETRFANLQRKKDKVLAESRKIRSLLNPVTAKESEERKERVESRKSLIRRARPNGSEGPNEQPSLWDPTNEFEVKNSRGDVFEKGLVELGKYLEVHGNTRVPAKYVSDSGFKLGQWLLNIQRKYKDGTLETTAYNQLRRKGITFNKPVPSLRTIKKSDGTGDALEITKEDFKILSDKLKSALSERDAFLKERNEYRDKTVDLKAELDATATNLMSAQLEEQKAINKAQGFELQIVKLERKFEEQLRAAYSALNLSEEQKEKIREQVAAEYEDGDKQKIKHDKAYYKANKARFIKQVVPIKISKSKSSHPRHTLALRAGVSVPDDSHIINCEFVSHEGGNLFLALFPDYDSMGVVVLTNDGSSDYIKTCLFNDDKWEEKELSIAGPDAKRGVGVSRPQLLEYHKQIKASLGL